MFHSNHTNRPITAYTTLQRGFICSFTLHDTLSRRCSPLRHTEYDLLALR